MAILRLVLGPGLAAGMRLRCFFVLSRQPLRPAGLCPACRPGGIVVLVVRLRVAVS